jgi:GxxExxY protein
LLEPTPEQDRLATQIVDSAFAVHMALGPGLLESVYEECLSCELGLRQIPVRRQVQQPIFYKNIRLNSGLRLDMVVGEDIVVEVKAVDKLAAVHDAQILTYLRLSGFRLGFLLNFNVPLMKTGIRRIIRPL